LKERDYYPIIESFFKMRGYYTFVELMVFKRGKVMPDILAVDLNFSKVTAVEVKVNNFKKAFWQGFTYLAFSDHVYLAFPKHYANYAIRKYKSIIDKFGLGIIALTPKVKILREATPSSSPDKKLKCVLLHRIRKKVLEGANLS